MKHKILMVFFTLFISGGILSAQKNAPSSVIDANDSLFMAMQLRSDSLKYASQEKMAQIKLQAYKDSLIYARMSTSELYALKLKESNRYYKTIEERLLVPQMFIMVFFFLSTVVIVYMIIASREKDKRRTHEYRMAQLEKGIMEKYSDGENGIVPMGGMEQKEYKKINDELSISTPSSMKEYMAGDTKHRRRGILFIIAGLAVMIFFFSIGHGAPWQIGLIPIFIGVAYLYVDYVSIESKRREWKAYQEHISQQAEKKESAPEENPIQEGKEEE